VLCAIHNFICLHDPSEDTAPSESSGEMMLCGDKNPDYQGQADEEDIDNGSRLAMCECIAQEMWDQYQGILRERGLLDSGSDSEVSDSNPDALDENELLSI
jgi:hypothetical protein